MKLADLNVNEHARSRDGQAQEGPAGRALRFSNYDAATARAEREAERAAWNREADELAKLPPAARRARRRSDLRRCLDGDAVHVLRVHVVADGRGRQALARARAKVGAVRRRTARGPNRTRSVATRKPIAAGTAGDPVPDPAPAPTAKWHPKSKAEQTVIVVKTRNKKLGEGAWASTLPVRQTCPETCPLLDHGCYAQRGPGGHVQRLETNASRQGMTALDLAHEEATLIRRATPLRAPGTPLRLHSSGDSSTDERAEIVSAASNDWPGPVWSYTHAWRTVAREAWGRVSILASVERHEDAADAMKRGYAPALEVAEHPEDGRPWRAGGVRWIPCPSEIDGAMTCAECRLCFDAEKLLRRGAGITFAAHGSGAGRVRDVLVQLRKKGEVGR